MIKIIILALFLSSVSFTISTTQIFEPIREKADNIHPKLGELIRCPYCLSHWIAFIVMLPLYGITVPVVLGIYFYDFIITLFAAIGLSGVVHFVLLRTYRPVAEMELQRKIDRLQEAQKNV